MSFCLSSVLAYMTGVSLSELQLDLFTAPNQAGGTAEETPESKRDGRFTAKSVSAASGTANDNNEASAASANWLWHARHASVRRLIASKKSQRPPSSAAQPTHIAAVPARRAMSAVSRVTAALPCLGCSESDVSPSSEPAVWGTPRWPTCTIIVDEEPGERIEKGKTRDPSKRDGAQARDDCVEGTEDGIIVRWATAGEDAGSWSTTAPSQLRVRVCGSDKGHEPSAFTGATLGPACTVFMELSGAGAPDTCTSRDSPPASLLLPDGVCLSSANARSPLPAANTATTIMSPPSSASIGETLAGNDGTPTDHEGGRDASAVDIVLVAVEAVPELFEVRRQGLRLYKELVLRLYKRSVEAFHERVSEQGDAVLVEELPSLQWRAELWTPSVSEDAVDGATAVEATVCREVVQSGVFSTLAGNKSVSGSRVASPRSDGDTTASVKKNDPVRRASNVLGAAYDDAAPPLASLRHTLRTFVHWWSSISQVAGAVLNPTHRSCVDQPAEPSTPPAAPTNAASEKSCPARVATLPARANAGTSEDVVRLLNWWSATTIRPATACLSRPSPLPALPSGTTPFFGAVLVPSYLRHASHGDPSAGEEGVRDGGGDTSVSATSVPALTLCFVNPKGTWVYEYDREALNVLCRAVHALRAAVWVCDAAQKAALLDWMRCCVRQSPAAAPSAVSTSRSSTPSYLEYPYDAVAEVEQRCFCLDAYVFDRHRRVLADGADGAEANNDGGEGVNVSAETPLRNLEVSRAWCLGARMLACSDLLGRRRLDLFTSPLQHPKKPLPSSCKATASATAAPLPPPPPAVTLNAVPPSFLSYVLTQISESGVEVVEQISGNLRQMGHRLTSQ